MAIPGPVSADPGQNPAYRPSAIHSPAWERMGQRLFEPPGVQGWDGHRSWLNTATMMVRLFDSAQLDWLRVGYEK